MSDWFPIPPGGHERRALLLFELATLGVGAAGSLVTQPSLGGWYHGLVRPGITPPDWLFAPVWTALYVLMAYAAWRVWRPSPAREALAGEMAVAGPRAGESRRGAMTMYAVQLALNFAWSVLFFGAHWIFAAFAESLALLGAALATGILFYRRDRLAGLLWLPYLGWLAFAAALSGAFWALNPPP